MEASAAGCIATVTEAAGTIKHTHYDPKEDRWTGGSLPHSSIAVEVILDQEMYEDEQTIQKPLRNPNTSNPLRMRCVVDTGTQITAMGKNQAETMGIDCEKLAGAGTSISSISGEKIKPMGSFFAKITGTVKKEGKERRITTKDVVYVSEKTPTPYLSRAVLRALGVVPADMQIGEYAGAATSEEDFITCTEVRGEKGGRRCECPSREPVPDEPIWEGQWTEEQIPAMKRAIIRHYEAGLSTSADYNHNPKWGNYPQ